MNKQASNWLIVVAILITIAAIAALAQAGNSQAQTTEAQATEAQAPEAIAPETVMDEAPASEATETTDSADIEAAIAPASVSIQSAWIRPTLGANRNTAAYATLINTSATPARLIGAAVVGASKAELHNSVMENGIMRMRQVEAIDIPAAGSVSLAPGGLHIMVFGLENGLEAGNTATITLTVEGSGDLTIEAPVSLSAPPASEEAESETDASGSDEMMDDSNLDHSGH